MANSELYFATKHAENVGVVGRTLEFERVSKLERRQSYPDLRTELTEHLRRKDADLGWAGKNKVATELRIHQAWMLYEALLMRGAIGNLGVGVGKTLLSWCMPVMFEETVKRPMLLVPGGLYSKTMRDFEALARVWRGHPNLSVVTYQQLSRRKGEEVLERKVPDMFICDEVHALKNTQASCTRKVKRWIEEHNDIIFVGFSGTIVTRSLNNAAHLMYWALGEKSPLPHSLSDRLLWALATDEGVPEDRRPDPGALKDFCAPGETIRLGLRRRLLESYGVVATESPLVKTEDGTDIALVVTESDIVVDSPAVRAALIKLRATGRMDEEVMTTALESSARAKELALGFFYRWVWPEGKRNEEWIKARQAWRKFVRKTIKNSANSEQPYDSEEQVKYAVINGQLTCPEDQWERWVAVKDQYEIKTEAVWVDDQIADKIAAWVEANPEGGIVWVRNDAIIQLMRSKYPKIPVFEAGNNAIGDIISKSRTVIASTAHITGKNLQFGFHKNLVVQSPPTGTDWEQLMGRTHRSGQPEDEVTVEVVMHTVELWEVFEKARRDARYLQDLWGAVQRLNYATIDVTGEADVARRILAEPPNPLWRSEWKLEIDDGE